MRLFVAIDIPPEVKDSLRALLDRWKPLAKLNWSPVDNLHITTKFIGEWPEARLDEMKTALAEVPVPGPIDIEIRGLGWFPNPRHPRVFWAGIEAGELLRDLARATEQATAKRGVPVEERPYSPHLTLARIRSPMETMETSATMIPQRVLVGRFCWKMLTTAVAVRPPASR